MSLAHLNQESRNELERRVLAAALKLSLLKGDKLGAKLAHKCLSGLLKIEKKAEQPPTVGLTTTTEQVPFIDNSEVLVEVAPPEILELPEITGLDGNGTVYDLSSVETASFETTSFETTSFETTPVELVELVESASVYIAPEESVAAPTAAPEEASDKKNDVDSAILLLQKIGEKPAKQAPNIDFELPPAEKAKMNEASAKPAKVLKPIKPTSAAAKEAPTAELTATTENQTIYGTEGDQMIAGIILPPFLTEPQVGLQYHALYKMLGVRQTATRDDIHKTFLRLVRRILRELKGAKRPSRQELLGYLRKVWIAHDILADPNTRTDYDFRDLGLRGTVETESTPTSDAPSKPASTQMLLRIGELLQVAGLLETAELEIACDMHKAMPEMMFGTFLVRQGFIADSELESVLYGQKALRAGAISVAQFQVAMELSRGKTMLVKDALVEKGFATQARLDELDEQTESGSAPVAPVETATIAAPLVVAHEEVAIASKNNLPVTITENSSLESIEERLATAQPLQISKAAPSWKDQLDWTSPTEEESPKEENKEVDAPAGSALEIAPNVTSETVEIQSPDAIETIGVTQAEPGKEEALEGVPVRPKKETTVTEHEPGLFSHMREAASFYDAEEDFFSHYNYAQPENEPLKTEVLATKLEDCRADEESPAETESSDAIDASEELKNSNDLDLEAEAEIESHPEPGTISELETEALLEPEKAPEVDIETTGEKPSTDLAAEITVEDAPTASFEPETENEFSSEDITESPYPTENDELITEEITATISSDSFPAETDTSDLGSFDDASARPLEEQPENNAEQNTDIKFVTKSESDSDEDEDDDEEKDKDEEYDDRYDDYDK